MKINKQIDLQVMYSKLCPNSPPLIDRHEESAATSGTIGEAIDLEVTLQEADIYLAYGLYDNAEELLHKGMAVCPDPADFMARLLDSYYATKNVVDFEAEAMPSNRCMLRQTHTGEKW